VFLERLNREHRTRKEFAPGALALARVHAWPGTVRELKNCVERSFVLGDDVISLDVQPVRSIAHDNDECVRIPIGSTLAGAERALLLATLRHCGGSKRRTAEMLGVSVKTIYNKIVGLHDSASPPRPAARDDGPARIGTPCPHPPNGHCLLSI
jgi:DNA-binding NtrC family response regulator